MRLTPTLLLKLLLVQKYHLHSARLVRASSNQLVNLRRLFIRWSLLRLHLVLSHHHQHMLQQVSCISLLAASSRPVVVHGLTFCSSTSRSLARSSAHPVLAIKEESKGIIAQLLSYGVTPDYLISVGVSRDIIDISFHELGLAPPPFGPPPPPAVNPNFNRGAPPPPPPGIDPRHVGSEPLRNTSPPPANLLTPTPAPPPLDPELALVEARKRQELLARKALTIARNKAKARSLESELDSLFASATWAARAVKKEDDGDVVMLDDEFEEGEVEPEVEVVDDDADVGALRGSLAHTEETVTGPLAGPFGATAAETGDGRRRPVAVDFEAEPTISLPPSHTSRPGPSYITDMPSKMVIDLSESEGEDDDEDDELSRGVKLERAPSMQQESSGDGGEEADSAAKRQLEEKELEIKRIMERIAQMEKKTKGRGTPSRQSSVPAASTAATAAETTPRLSPPPMALEEAREHVQLLEAERSTLAAVVGEEEEGTPALEVVMDVEESLGGGDEGALVSPRDAGDFCCTHASLRRCAC